MKHCIIALIATICVILTVNTAAAQEKNWQQCMLDAINTFPKHGGYYTGRKATLKFPTNAWQGLNKAFVMNNGDKYPHIDQMSAQPSFCSLATYMVLLKALELWDCNHTYISTKAWINLKPYVGLIDNINVKGFGQDDGQGCWGRANANGPGIAVMIAELDAGTNYTAYRGAKSERNKEHIDDTYLSDNDWNNHEIWSKAVPGDFMKIFWNREDSDCGAIIGCNGIKNDDQERGHSTIFLGYTPDGNVIYWSSNGPGKEPKNKGYGIAECNKTAIQRVVFTHINRPENFNKAKNISPMNINKWLNSLDGKHHGTTKELYKHCKIK